MHTTNGKFCRHVCLRLHAVSVALWTTVSTQQQGQRRPVGSDINDAFHGVGVSRWGLACSSSSRLLVDRPSRQRSRACQGRQPRGHDLDPRKHYTHRHTAGDIWNDCVTLCTLGGAGRGQCVL